MQNNQGAHVISTVEASVALKRCLITDNTTTDVLFSYSIDGTFDECTIAHNPISGAYVFEFLEAYNVGMSHDIIDAPAQKSVHFTANPGAAGAQVNAGYILASDISTLPSTGNPSIVAGQPYFVDANHGDYHLAPFAQTALDFAPNTFADLDLDGHAAGIDLPTIPNSFGTTDLGAYERHSMFDGCGVADTIFCNGFE